MNIPEHFESSLVYLPQLLMNLSNGQVLYNTATTHRGTKHYMRVWWHYIVAQLALNYHRFCHMPFRNQIILFLFSDGKMPPIHTNDTFQGQVQCPLISSPWKLFYLCVKSAHQFVFISFFVPTRFGDQNKYFRENRQCYFGNLL